jgi:hypothetical protein
MVIVTIYQAYSRSGYTIKLNCGQDNAVLVAIIASLTH